MNSSRKHRERVRVGILDIAGYSSIDGKSDPEPFGGRAIRGNPPPRTSMKVLGNCIARKPKDEVSHIVDGFEVGSERFSSIPITSAIFEWEPPPPFDVQLMMIQLKC